MAEYMSVRDFGGYVKAAMLGAPAEDVVTMLAIALCEGPGPNNTIHLKAYNPGGDPSCPDCCPCYGPFQMDEGLGQLLFHPGTAAQHAAEKYRASAASPRLRSEYGDNAKWAYWGCGPAHRKGYEGHMTTARAALHRSGSGVKASARCRKNCRNWQAFGFDSKEICLSDCMQTTISGNSDPTGKYAGAKPGASNPGPSTDCQAECDMRYNPNSPEWVVCVTNCGGTVTGDVTQPAQDVAGALLKWTEALARVLMALLDYHTWVRLAEFIGGVLLILVAFYVLIGGSKDAPAPVKQVGETALAAAA